MNPKFKTTVLCLLMASGAFVAELLADCGYLNYDCPDCCSGTGSCTFTYSDPPNEHCAGPATTVCLEDPPVYAVKQTRGGTCNGTRCVYSWSGQPYDGVAFRVNVQGDCTGGS